MRIAIDAMGGDNAPDEIIAGALESIEFLAEDDQLILVGPRDIIEPRLPSQKSRGTTIIVEHAPDTVGMDEPPVESLRKKPKSSISIAAKLAKRDQADAVISAGNTGACVAALQMRVRTLPGVNRPGIAVVFPTFEGPVTICDVGANIACKPINIYQYAVMAGIYSRHFVGIESPRVGLMSIGQEDAKGNEVVKKARDLIKSDDKVNFVGNIEGRDIFNGVCDVAVCEGFVGNVILKLTETGRRTIQGDKARVARRKAPPGNEIQACYEENLQKIRLQRIRRSTAARYKRHGTHLPRFEQSKDYKKRNPCCKKV